MTLNPIETRYTKRLNELKRAKGEAAYFDRSLLKLFDCQGDEALAFYRERHPGGPCILFKVEGDQGVIITPSAKRQGAWQITYFDERGFSGDHSEPTEAKAMGDAYVEGYRVPDPIRGEEQMNSDAFIQGVLNTDRVQREHRAWLKKRVGG